ncbi:unnamed protein product [Paramecium pentaurelia]|uniref:Uncharacterized protein n=1 Tax=Paramecium pentaurelia TaxID=43138 RepID=A0A8S1UXY7_9CILI|nr:unnamed protein product [Paramecium pentaurelia]
MNCFEHNSPYTLLCWVKGCNKKFLCHQCMQKHDPQHFSMIQSLNDFDTQISQIPKSIQQNLILLSSQLNSAQTQITLNKDSLKKQIIKLSDLLKARLDVEINNFCSSAIDYTTIYYKQFENDIAAIFNTISEHSQIFTPQTGRPINEFQFTQLIQQQDKMFDIILPKLSQQVQMFVQQISNNQLIMKTENFHSILNNNISKTFQLNNLLYTNETIQTQTSKSLIQKNRIMSPLIPKIDLKKNASQLFSQKQQSDRINDQSAFYNDNIVELSGSRFLQQKSINTVLTGHTDIILCVCAFSNTSILSGSAGGTIRIFYIDNAITQTKLNDHKGDVLAIIKINDTNFSSASSDQTVRVWNYQRKVCEYILVGHEQPIKALILLQDTDQLASGSLDQTIKIWSLKRPKIKLNIKDHQKIFALCYVQSKALIVSGGEGILSVFNIINGYCRDKLEGHTGNVLCLKYLKEIVNGEFVSLISSGGSDKKIILWNLDRAQKLYILIGHQDYVTCLTFDNENNQLWSGGADQTIRCWDIDKGRQVFIFKRHTDQISCIEYIASRELIISGSWDKKIRVTSKSILVN